MFERISYPITLRSNIPDVYSHKYMKIKINSDVDLPLQKTLNMHKAVTLNKFVFNKNITNITIKRFLKYVHAK